MPTPSGAPSRPAHRAAQPPSASGRASLETAYRLTEATPPYPCGLWTLTNTTSGEVIPFRCKRWTCPTCAPKLVSKWAAIIDQAPIQRHLVITALGPDAGTARARLRNVLKGIRRGELRSKRRRRSPAALEYFCALEGRTQPGYHAHLLTWGDFLPQRSLSRLAARYGAGSVCWVRSIADDERTAHVRTYVVKHLVGKVHPDQHKVGRRVRYSRNFWQGRTARQVAEALWPPDPGPWVLNKPDVDARAADKELRLEARQILWEDWQLEHLSEDQLRRLRVIRNLTWAEEQGWK